MKTKRKVLVGFLLFVLCIAAPAQGTDGAVWNYKKCAVCLTYDDGLNIDLDNVVPALDSLGFKGTFYIPGNSPALSKRMNEWRAAAKEGHELGNHTLFHPCVGKVKGREWVSPDYDLGQYTMQRMVDEIQIANTLLKAIDGKTIRTFAYTCGDEKIGDSDFMVRLKNEFVGARGIKGEMKTINEIDVYRIGSYMINGQSGNELINLVKKAMETNTLLVFLFHGVGGEHTINVSLTDHSKLLHFLKQNEKNIWIAPLAELTQYIKTHQKKN